MALMSLSATGVARSNEQEKSGSGEPRSQQKAIGLMLRAVQPPAQVGQFGADFGAIGWGGLAFAPLLFDVFREQRELRLDLIDRQPEAAEAHFGLDVHDHALDRVLAEAGLRELTEQGDPQLGQQLVAVLGVLPAFEQVALRTLDRPFDDVRPVQLPFGQVAHDRSPR